MDNTKSLEKKFKEVTIVDVNLQEENTKLKRVISKLVKELDETKKQLVLSAEHNICEVQIQKLQEVALERKLTLEEVKTLDLLIKNKRLITKKSTSNNELTLPPELTEDELMRIAESDKEEEESSD